MEKQKFINELVYYINKKILGNNGIVVVNKNTQLFEDQIINSMKIIELIAFVEKKLKIRIEDSMITMENFKSVKITADKFCNYGKQKKT